MSYLFADALKNGIWKKARPNCTTKHKIRKSKALIKLGVFVTFEHEFKMREEPVGVQWKELSVSTCSLLSLLHIVGVSPPLHLYKLHFGF